MEFFRKLLSKRYSYILFLLLLILLFSALLILGTNLNRETELEINGLIVREHVLQAVAVRNSFSENIGRIINESGILSSYSFPEFELGLRTSESIENLLEIELDAYSDNAAYSYIDFSGDKSIHVGDAGEAGSLALELIPFWTEQYRAAVEEGSELIVTPVVSGGGSALIGLIYPVYVDSEIAGMLITVVDLREPLDRYIIPIADKMSGTPVVLDSSSRVIWDMEGRRIGRPFYNMIGRRTDDFVSGELSGFREIRYDASGDGAFSVYLSWASSDIGNERIAFVLITRETELNAIMNAHNTELIALYIAGALLFTAVSLAFLGFRSLILKQNIFRENQWKLENMVDEKTSELRSLLNRYTILFESASDAINILKNGVFIECNTKSLELFEADAPSDFLGKTPGDVSPEYQEDGQLSETKTEMLIRKSREEGPQVFEWRHRTLKGRVFDAEVSLKMMEIEGSEVTHAIIRDVSERVRNLREKEAMLKEIHHRVKNNLAIISSFLHLQQDKFSSGEASEVILDTQRRVEVMAKMHELLYSQSSLVEISSAEYFREILGFFQLRYPYGDGYEFSADIEDTGLDPDRSMYAGFVLSELTDNAVRHGAFPVGVSFRTSDGLGILKISDSGAGFVPGEDENQWGLGVRIARALEAQLGGTLTWTEDGSGTTVRFSFPL